MVKQVAPVKAANRTGMNGNGSTESRPTNVPAVPMTGELFDAASLKFLRQMRFNPLPMLDPAMLGTTLDQFDYGFLRQAALLWEQMCRRDDTLVTVKPQLENAVASKDWGVFTVEGADETEAARHKAALEYFYNNLSVTDAFDRNERGGRDKMIEQMMRSESFFYAVHHFVWRPSPGKMLPVSIEKKTSNIERRTPNAEQRQQLAPVPALTATLEYVPLWFFENTTGQLRFLPDGGFGVNGRELNWDGEWMVTCGRGLMFAASICYTFKRLTFQDWTIFNERYAQNKVVVMTPAAKDTAQGKAAKTVAEEFNSDQGIVFYEWSGSDKPPISLLGPDGTASVEIFDKFIERQDRKMSSMYRGNDLSMMSRAGKGEKPTGASLQGDEGDDMEKGACRRIAGVCQEFIDRQVIKYCFGEGVEPLAYFGLPDMAVENTTDIRESAGFLADRGAQIPLSEIADRLGIEVEAGEEDHLQPLKIGTPAPTGDARGVQKQMTANEAQADLEKFLGEHRDDFLKALSNDLIPLRLAMEHVIESQPEQLMTSNVRALRSQLPHILREITRVKGGTPHAAVALNKILKGALKLGIEEAKNHE